MGARTYAVTEQIVIEIKAHADLAIQGWEQMEVHPLADRRRMVSVQTEGDTMRVTLLDDGEVFVPTGAEVHVERVGGDAYMRTLRGKLVVDRVGGDLALQDIADTVVAHVGGDCIVAGANGPLAFSRVGGDLVGTGVSGSLSAVNVGGDINLHVVGGSADVKAGGDVSLSLEHTGDQSLNLRAIGDVDVFLPVEGSAELNILSRGEDIRLRLGGKKQRVEERAFQYVIGAGTAKINIQAGGDVKISDEEDNLENFVSARENLEEHWKDLEHSRVEREMSEDEEPFTHGEDITRRVNRHVEEAMRRADERIAAAMRRVEERTRQMNREGMVPPMPPIPTVGRPRKSIFVAADATVLPTQPAAPVPPVAKNVVSEEERLLVLSMLQEKKISAEEAARLLETLERS